MVVVDACCGCPASMVVDTAVATAKARDRSVVVRVGNDVRGQYGR